VLVQEGPTSSYNDPFGEAKAQQAELLDTGTFFNALTRQLEAYLD